MSVCVCLTVLYASGQFNCQTSAANAIKAFKRLQHF